MVKKFMRVGQTYFACESCSVWYAEKIHAAECETYCTKHEKTSLVIIKHAVHNL